MKTKCTVCQIERPQPKPLPDPSTYICGHCKSKRKNRPLRKDAKVKAGLGGIKYLIRRFLFSGWEQMMKWMGIQKQKTLHGPRQQSAPGKLENAEQKVSDQAEKPGIAAGTRNVDSDASL